MEAAQVRGAGAQQRPSLCSTEGPSLRPDLAYTGAFWRAAVKDGQGHRSSRRAASLRAARRNAKLEKGEDFSGPFSLRNGYRSRKPPPEITRMSSNRLRQPARVVPARCAAKAVWLGKSGVGARQRYLILPKAAPHRTGLLRLNDYHRESSIDCPQPPVGSASAIGDFVGGSVLLSMGGSILMSAEAAGDGPGAESGVCRAGYLRRDSRAASASIFSARWTRRDAAGSPLPTAVARRRARAACSNRSVTGVSDRGNRG